VNINLPNYGFHFKAVGLAPGFPYLHLTEMKLKKQERLQIIDGKV